MMKQLIITLILIIPFLLYSKQIKIGKYYYNIISNYDKHFKDAGNKYNIEWKLLKAIAVIESDLNPNCKGKIGEVGIMQINTRHWKVGKGVKNNIFTGAKIYNFGRKVVKKYYKKQWQIMKYSILTYNHGFGNFYKRRFRNYVYYNSVMRIYNWLKIKE